MCLQNVWLEVRPAKTVKWERQVQYLPRGNRLQHGLWISAVVGLLHVTSACVHWLTYVLIAWASARAISFLGWQTWKCREKEEKMVGELVRWRKRWSAGVLKLACWVDEGQWGDLQFLYLSINCQHSIWEGHNFWSAASGCHPAPPMT